MEYETDCFVWVPGPREFRLVETTSFVAKHDATVPLTDLAPLREDVQRRRVVDGWDLIASKPETANGQDLINDVWARARAIPEPPVTA